MELLLSRAWLSQRTMKRILLLSQVFPPETNAGANRLGSMAHMLSKYYDVHVVTLKPSHPSPSLYEGISLRHHDSTLPYKIRRAFSFHPHKGKLIVRALREHIMAFCLAARAVSVPADIVICSPPSMFLGPVSLIVARAKGARFVWDVRDITWKYARETARSSPIMRFGMWALEKYMLFALFRADLVVGATPGVTRMLIESGLSPRKAITVSNGIIPDLLEVAQKTNKPSRGGHPIVTYAGLFGYNYNLEPLLDAAKMLPTVDFVLAGDGPELPKLRSKAKKLGVGNVIFRGYIVDRTELLRVYGESDILFAKVRNSPTLNETAVSFKLFEYMATGRPLVYAGKGLAVEFLDKIGCALTVSAEDPEAIITAISKLLSDPGLMYTLGSKGRDFVRRNYHRDELMKGLASELRTRFG